MILNKGSYKKIDFKLKVLPIVPSSLYVCLCLQKNLMVCSSSQVFPFREHFETTKNNIVPPWGRNTLKKKRESLCLLFLKSSNTKIYLCFRSTMKKNKITTKKWYFYVCMCKFKWKVKNIEINQWKRALNELM